MRVRSRWKRRNSKTERLDLLTKLSEIRSRLAERTRRRISRDCDWWKVVGACRRAHVRSCRTKKCTDGFQAPAAVAHRSLFLPASWRTSTALVFPFPREDENELSGHLPELHDLPRAGDFEASVSERNRLGVEDLDLRSDLWESNATQNSPEEIEVLSTSLSFKQWSLFPAKSNGNSPQCTPASRATCTGSPGIHLSAS